MADINSRQVGLHSPQPESHTKRAWVAVPVTSSRRQSTRLQKIAQSHNPATSLSPFWTDHASFSPASSEECASTTSSSRSLTPASNTDSVGFERIFNSSLPLDYETLLSSLAPHHADSLHMVTTPENAGHNRKAYSSKQAARITRSSAKKLTLNAPQKRKLSTPNRSGGDDGDDEQDGQTGRGKRKAQPSSHGFPCPYWMKHQPRSLKNSCRRSTFDTIPRLKEHLQRVHFNRQLCSRCYAEFADLSLHDNQDPACAVNSNPFSLQYGHTQYYKLHDKMRGRSDVEKWREIWTILFNEADPASIPLPNMEDLSMHQRRDLINRLEESVLSSFKNWEAHLVQHAQAAGLLPHAAADGDLDIAWIINPLRLSLVDIFAGFREAIQQQQQQQQHARYLPATARPGDWGAEAEGVGTARVGHGYPGEEQQQQQQQQQLAYAEPGGGNNQGAIHALGVATAAPFTAGEAGQTINLAAVQMHEGIYHDQQHHHQPQLSPGMQYPPSPNFQDDFPTGVGAAALHNWFHHEASPYHDQYGGPGYAYDQ